MNILGPSEVDKESRGFFIKTCITCNLGCQSNIDHCVHPRLDSYNGFHLLLLDTSSPQTDIVYFNIRDNHMNCSEVPKDNNCICLSISKSTQNQFHKVAKGREKFKEIVEKFNNKDKKCELIGKLLELLKDRTKYGDDPVLKSQAESSISQGNKTHFAKNPEELSSLYFFLPESRSGTRTHAKITMDIDGYCKYYEKTLHTAVDEEDMQWNETLFKFDIETQ